MQNSIIPSEGSFKKISVVSPVYNEEESIEKLAESLTTSLEEIGLPYEIILVNDCSIDTSLEKLQALGHQNEKIKVIDLRKNSGQTAALSAGFDLAEGDIIIPIDADLQNDPSDISMLIDKLREGYDVVSGWRKDRKDNSFKRTIPSKIANWLISINSGVPLHDYGCTLKAYRSEFVKGIPLYGEMHRFIPIYAKWRGAKIAELPVKHHPRTTGQSKYGLERTFKVLLDLLVIKFLDQYQTKPIYVFGGFGVISILLSSVTGLWAFYLKIFEKVSFIVTPLPLLTVLFLLAGTMAILMGILAELLVRTYYESQKKSVYSVRGTVNVHPKPQAIH